jgi:hypothetical protein
VGVIRCRRFGAHVEHVWWNNHGDKARWRVLEFDDVRGTVAGYS